MPKVSTRGLIGIKFMFYMAMLFSVSIISFFVSRIRINIFAKIIFSSTISLLFMIFFERVFYGYVDPFWMISYAIQFCIFILIFAVIFVISDYIN